MSYLLCSIMESVSKCSSSVSVQKPVITSLLIPQFGIMFFYLINFCHVPFACISTIHQLQNSCVAALYRQMDILARCCYTLPLYAALSSVMSFGCEVLKRTRSKGFINATISRSLCKCLLLYSLYHLSNNNYQHFDPTRLLLYNLCSINSVLQQQ